MQNFDGSSRRKRNINLGGTPRAQSATTVISRARYERRTRIEAREQHHAALRIQAFARGCRVRREIRAWTQSLPITDDLARMTAIAVIGNDLKRGEFVAAALKGPSAEGTGPAFHRFWDIFTSDDTEIALRWNLLSKRLLRLLIRSPVLCQQSEELFSHLLLQNVDPLDELRSYFQRSTWLYLLHNSCLGPLLRHFPDHSWRALESCLQRNRPESLFGMFGTNTLHYDVEENLAFLIVVPELIKSEGFSRVSFEKNSGRALDGLLNYLEFNLGMEVEAVQPSGSHGTSPKPSTNTLEPKSSCSASAYFALSTNVDQRNLFCPTYTSSLASFGLRPSLPGQGGVLQPRAVGRTGVLESPQVYRVVLLSLTFDGRFLQSKGQSQSRVRLHVDRLRPSLCYELLVRLLEVSPRLREVSSCVPVVRTLLLGIEIEMEPDSEGRESHWRTFERALMGKEGEDDDDADDDENLNTRPGALVRPWVHENENLQRIQISGSSVTYLVNVIPKHDPEQPSMPRPGNVGRFVTMLRMFVLRAARGMPRMAPKGGLSVAALGIEVARRFTGMLGIIIQAFSDRAVCRYLWREGLKPNLASGNEQAGTVFDPLKADLWTSVGMFAMVFSWSLMATDDQEFRDGKRFPLEVRDSREVVEVFKYVCLGFQRLLTPSLGTTLGTAPLGVRGRVSTSPALRVLPGLPFGTLVYLTKRVIKLLYDRSSRQPFISSEAFTILSPDMIFDPPTIAKLVLDGERLFEVPASGDREVEDDAGTLDRTAGSYELRIDIVRNLPFLIPFETRVEIFRALVRQDRERMGLPTSVYGFVPPAAKVRIRRPFVFEDGYERLNKLGNTRLKLRVQITFVDEHGLEEAGIDGGGPFKEFMLTLAKQAFSPAYGLFKSTQDNMYYPNANVPADIQDQQLLYLEFIGRMVGKALYEGLLLDVSFASFFLTKWLWKRNKLDDLASLDGELYRGLLFLKNYLTDQPDGKIDDLALNFTVQEEVVGKQRTVELIPNGMNVPVTNDNVLRYLFSVANYHLNVKISKPCGAFLRGLSDIVDPRWLKLFNEQELAQLMGGSACKSFDISDLKRAATYHPTSARSHPVIDNLWQVIEEMTDEERRALLKFITSCPRAPLLGFKELEPPFCIHLLRRTEADDRRLPTASTCVNLLKLPSYKDKETLRRKLLYAIHSEAGFDLS